MFEATVNYVDVALTKERGGGKFSTVSLLLKRTCKGNMLVMTLSALCVLCLSKRGTSISI